MKTVETRNVKNIPMREGQRWLRQLLDCGDGAQRSRRFGLRTQSDDGLDIYFVSLPPKPKRCIAPLFTALQNAQRRITRNSDCFMRIIRPLEMPVQ